MQDEIELLHMILKNCFVNIFVIDKDANIVYVNDNAANALGLPAEELMRMSAYELLDRKLASSVAALKVLETKQEHIQAVTFANGNTMAVNARPVFDENGDIKNVVVFSQEQKVIEHFMQSIQHENQVISQTLSHVLQDSENNELIAVSDTIKHCLMMAKIAAYRESTIMLYGESGAGKEVIARYVHQNSQRNKKIFLPVNCAAIPHELMESEFFGYEKGAFTGSSRYGKLGLFELADGGTIFMDEIGELDLSMQSKLLRVLESKEIMRVGGTKIKKVNVRVVTATNRNLQEMVSRGEFREDLFYRLNVIPITVPPLRERKEDIAVFADYFMEKLNRKYNMNKKFTNEAVTVFQAYRWPGNVREMRNIVERIFVVVQDDIITARHVREILGIGKDVQFDNENEKEQPNSLIACDEQTIHEATEAFQRQYIESILRNFNGHVEKAAAAAGIGRSGFYKKIDKLGMNSKAFKEK